MKPNWFVMENVTGILVSKTANGERVSDIIKSEFSSIGYRVEFKTLLSADYGVPQKRKRVIFIGTRTGHKIEFPMPTHSEIPHISIDERKIKRWVPVSSVLLSHDEVEEVYFHSQKMIDGFLKRKANNTKNGKGFGWQILKDDQPSYTISARTGRTDLMHWSNTQIQGSECSPNWNARESRPFPMTIFFVAARRPVTFRSAMRSRPFWLELSQKI